MLKKLSSIPINLIQSSVNATMKFEFISNIYICWLSKFLKLLQITFQHLCNPISFLKIYPTRCAVDLN